jgi:ABC-type branched-subunit amino acid transport system substrate-binding protein
MGSRLLAGIALLGVLVAAHTAGAQTSAPGVTDKTIRIGAWLPLTGPIAVHGTVQRKGTEAYFRMVNDRGGVNGRRIEWIVEDNAYDPQKTVAAARKLIERDQVFALVNGNGTAQSAAAFRYVLDEAKVPLINTYGGAQNWYKPPKENLYGVLALYEEQAQSLGRWAGKDGAKNVLVVHNDPAAFENVAKNVEPGLKTAVPTAAVKLLPVKLGTADYVPIALQVAAAKPDAVVAILPTNEVVALAKELARQNYKTTVYTYAPNVSMEALELGKGAVEGLRAVSFVLPPTSDHPGVKEYRDALTKYFPDTKPDFQSLFTWAAAKVFVEAVSRIKGPLTREALIQSVHSLKNYETGALPPVSFSEERHLGVTMVQRVQIQGGEWKTVGGFIDPAGTW